MVGELNPLDGMVKRHNHLKIARYHQHLAEQLDLNKSPVEYIMEVIQIKRKGYLIIDFESCLFLFYLVVLWN